MVNSHLNINEKDFRIQSTELYLCNERNTKLIYKNLTELEVIGIAELLNGKIIEVVDKKILNRQYFYKVKYDGLARGWISLDNSIRLYRIPTSIGRYTPHKKYSKKTLGLIFDEEHFLNRNVEAKYYFVTDEEVGLLINIIGNSTKMMPIMLNLFHKFIAPPRDTVMNIRQGTKLYQDNKFETIIGELTEDKTVKITGYYEKLDEVRIELNKKKYWIRADFTEDSTTFYDTLGSVELIDQIMYLKNENSKLKSRLKQAEKRREFLKQNISIDNDLQKLFLKKYLGDFDEVE